jgi:hypothetical protein
MAHDLDETMKNSRKILEEELSKYKAVKNFTR